MTLTGDYRDNTPAIARVFNDLAATLGLADAAATDVGTTTAAAGAAAGAAAAGGRAGRRTPPLPPLLLPGRYSTGTPWLAGDHDEEDMMDSHDDDDDVSSLLSALRPRRPHENTNAPRPQSWGIEVKLDGSVMLFGCEGSIALPVLLQKLVPGPPQEEQPQEEQLVEQLVEQAQQFLQQAQRRQQHEL